MWIRRALSFLKRIFKKRGNFSESIRKTIRKSNIIPSDRFDIAFFRYDALTMGIFAAFNIFSMNIPYPVVGSLMRTWVTAPTILPF